MNKTGASNCNKGVSPLYFSLVAVNGGGIFAVKA